MSERPIQKIEQTRQTLKQFIKADPKYFDAILASLASRSHLCLFGAQGSGKSTIAKVLYHLVADEDRASQQGYLSADFEDVLARVDLGELMQSREKAVFKKIVLVTFKWFDEIQRLGPAVLSALFHLLDMGKVRYLEDYEGEPDFYLIATANPTEKTSDNLNIEIPDPLWDRFSGVVWIPTVYGSDHAQVRDRRKEIEKLGSIWDKQDLKKLWDTVSKIEIPIEITFKITTMLDIMKFCQHAISYDSASLDVPKRELCSECNQNYVCSKIEKCTSARAKIAIEQLSKGFAFINNRGIVTLDDVKNAFVMAMWKRVAFFENQPNRLKALENLFDNLMTEIQEVKEIIPLIHELKQRYNEKKYQALENYQNAKVWTVMVIDDLHKHYASLLAQLREKFRDADQETQIKASKIAFTMLPPDLAQEFQVEAIKIKLTPETLIELATLSSAVFKKARKSQQEGNTELTITMSDGPETFEKITQAIREKRIEEA